ncbi:MAG: hypothetical protein ACTHMS_00185, partial [Jatrophihabitans sp.]|uniref:hypothetical protein n=1 Tax=Jatrophihabitans sp. TaxID=1932789 RepID=UPI003F7E17E9
GSFGPARRGGADDTIDRVGDRCRRRVDAVAVVSGPPAIERGRRMAVERVELIGVEHAHPELWCDECKRTVPHEIELLVRAPHDLLGVETICTACNETAQLSERHRYGVLLPQPVRDAI